MSQLQAVQEHIDTVRMALSKDEDAWDGTKVYQDNEMNALLEGRRQDSARDEARRYPGRAADQVRSSHQSDHGKGARFDGGVKPRESRQGGCDAAIHRWIFARPPAGLWPVEFRHNLGLNTA